MKTDIKESLRIKKAISKKMDIEWNDYSADDFFFIPGSKLFFRAKEFRTKTKALVGLYGFYIYVDSDINPNGITGKHDMGRTWTIDININGEIRPYRKKNWYRAKSLIYEYFRSFEELLARLEDTDLSDEALIERIKQRR